MKLKYNENAAALVWDIVNGSKDIGNWILTFEEKEIKGKGLREFLNNAAFNNGMINVVFVKDLKSFMFLMTNHMDFSDKDFFGNDKKEFFYAKVTETIELRDWNRFEDKVNNGAEFLKRLDKLRDTFKGENKGKLSLSAHFRTTKAQAMWEDIKYRYFLSAPKNYYFCKRLLPQSREEYELLFSLNKAAIYYQNLDYSQKVIQRIYSYDISSSHIGFIGRKKYPISGFTKAEESEYQEIIKNKKIGWMGDFNFHNLRYKVDLPINSGFWIQRIYDESGFLTRDFQVSLTNVDIEWFKLVFAWDSVSVNELYYCDMGYLSDDYMNMVDSLYKQKEEQKKGTYGKEICKFRAELPFGQSIKRVEYDGELAYNKDFNVFEVVQGKELSFEEIQNKILKRKIPAQIGMWTVAYSRLELVSIIMEIGIENVIYADTDCVKFICEEGIEIIKKRNKEIDQEIKDNKGNKYIFSKKLGRWQDEGLLAGIKVIGIKWYLTLDMNGEWDVKCAGGDRNSLLNWLKTQSNCFIAFNTRMKCPRLFKTIKAKGKTLDLIYSSGFDTDQIEEIKRLSHQLQIYSEAI